MSTPDPSEQRKAALAGESHAQLTEFWGQILGVPISGVGEAPVSAQWPNPEIPTVEHWFGRSNATDYERTFNDIETAQREARSDALYHAVLRHGEPESQEVFRTDETETVIETAKRFYEFIWEGR